MNSRTFKTIGLLPLVVFAALTAAAEEKLDPADRAKTIAPFIDDQTVLIARVDVSRIEIDALVDKVVELVPEAGEEGQRVRTEMKAIKGAFRQAGGKELYAVFSMADLDTARVLSPFFVVPLSDGVDEKKMAVLFRQTPLEVQQRLGDVLFVGNRATLTRLQGAQPSEHPELVKAFEAAGDTAAQALLLPPKYAARVIEEMLPNLPKEIGGGASTVITRGLLWAAVGADPPPKMALKVVIQSRDAEAAGAFREKWIAGLELLGKQQEVRQRMPAFDKLAELLRPKVEGDRLTLVFDEKNGGTAGIISLLKPPIEEARRAAQRSRSVNNLKQIALAMHNYHDANKHFPAAASHDADGKPLLSWRVQILPYVDQGKLYKQFHLDEPWNSEHNRKLISQMPRVYGCPASKLKEEGRTSYVVPVGKETVFPGHEGIPIKEIKDGTSQTIMAVEVDDDHAVIWTKPDDLPFDPENPAQGLGGLFGQGFNAAYCDGSVHFLSKDIDPKVLRALFTRAGGEVIPSGGL